MPRTKTTTTAAAIGMRRCIGSARFGIEAHDASPEDFPQQPSQKGGLGRMCRPHWSEYTRGLARDRKARLAVDAAVRGEGPFPPAGSVASARKGVGRRTAKEARAAKPEPIRVRPARQPGDAAIARGKADLSASLATYKAKASPEAPTLDVLTSHRIKGWRAAPTPESEAGSQGDAG